MPDSNLAWVQVTGRLRALIHTRSFPGGRLPTEPILAEQLQTSRGTLRRVLAQLEHEGLLIRKHGSGTYVNQTVVSIASRLDEVWDFTEMIRLAGYEPSVCSIEAGLQKVSTPVAEKLNLDAAAEVIAAANLFLAGGRPVIYCLDMIPGNLLREAYVPQELYGPIYTFLKRRCHQQVSFNISEIHAVNADARLAAALNCQAGMALHYFEEIAYNADHRPIMYSEEYYLPDVFHFQTLRRMMPAVAGPAAENRLVSPDLDEQIERISPNDGNFSPA